MNLANGKGKRRKLNIPRTKFTETRQWRSIIISHQITEKSRATWIDQPLPTIRDNKYEQSYNLATV